MPRNCYYACMSDLDNPTKHKLERLFDMRTGYVLDFSNQTFADFVQTSIGFDPYERYSGSKASVLRQIWSSETNARVRVLSLELLDRWRTNKLLEDVAVTPGEDSLFGECIAAVNALESDTESPVDLEFLERDFSEVDLTILQVPLSSQEVIQQRLIEIEICLNAKAPLAVIFLCGSTLEGLLVEVAEAQAPAFLGSSAAPRRNGTVRPLRQWTLADLIGVAREQGVIGEDVSGHADVVRNFRNYIHPRQQVLERFSPRMFTAKMAQQVLLATIADLGRL